MKKFSRLEMNNYREISTLFFNYGSYLFFEGSKGEMSFFPAEDSKVESHLLRTLICKSQGFLNRANWQEYDEPVVFLKSYELVDELMYKDMEVFAR